MKNNKKHKIKMKRNFIFQIFTENLIFENYK